MLIKEQGSIIFVSGVYGVGKSTLCHNISKKTFLPFYSAGDLISSKNGEIYGVNKRVKNKEYNQNLLVEIVSDILKEKLLIVLAGHFCILGEKGNPERLPLEVYKKLGISSIVLLEAEPDKIIRNLKSRDNIEYSKNQIEEFLFAERDCANSISRDLHIPLFVHNMKFNNYDIEKINSFLKEVYGEGIIRY